MHVLSFNNEHAGAAGGWEGGVEGFFSGVSPYLVAADVNPAIYVDLSSRIHVGALMMDFPGDKMMY